MAKMYTIQSEMLSEIKSGKIVLSMLAPQGVMIHSLLEKYSFISNEQLLFVAVVPWIVLRRYKGYKLLSRVLSSKTFHPS